MKRLALALILAVQLACALESPRVNVSTQKPIYTEAWQRHNVDQEPARVEVELQGGFGKPYEVER